MCGIFGEYSPSGQFLSEGEFLSVRDLAFRRGPDQGGYWSDGKMCQLGFRRLAILDLSEAGNQPMLSPNGRWAMVFNGEIYNYQDIQKKLNLSKTELKSHSDSEVILHAFQHWGIRKTAEELNGIFAIGLYDLQENEIHLIRDFAGVKPLYFGVAKNKVVFASQYDQVFHHPDFKECRKVSNRNLTDYLTLGYVPAPNAFFDQTYQVEPGQIVSFDISLELKKHFYYCYSNNRSDQYEVSETSAEGLSRFDSTFSKVIQRQLISDVSIGTLLSGGIDSPLVTLYSHFQNKSIESFTIGSTDPKFDETKYALGYAEAIGIKNHLRNYSEETLKLHIEEHFKAYSEPFGDYSSLPSFQVCEMVKERFTVALSGDGGDEVFWGYPRFLNYIQHFDWYKLPTPIRWVVAGVGRRFGKNISYGINQKSFGDWVLYKQSHNKLPSVQNFIPGSDNSEFIHSLYQAKDFRRREDMLEWLRWNEFYGHLQRVLLKMDRASMFHSLEVRVPFLDKDLLELSLLFKPELGIKHHEPKYVLKQTLRQHVQPELVNAKKMGFGIQIDDWLRSELKEEVMELLVYSDPYPYNTFDREQLRKYVESFMTGKGNMGWGIWILYSLQKWAKAFNIS